MGHSPLEVAAGGGGSARAERKRGPGFDQPAPVVEEGNEPPRAAGQPAILLEHSDRVARVCRVDRYPGLNLGVDAEPRVERPALHDGTCGPGRARRGAASGAAGGPPAPAPALRRAPLDLLGRGKRAWANFCMSFLSSECSRELQQRIAPAGRAEVGKAELWSAHGFCSWHGAPRTSRRGHPRHSHLSG